MFSSPSPLPLMDGGVVDNQGMDTLLKQGMPEETLYIFSDASRESDDLYKQPSPIDCNFLAAFTIGSLESLWWVLTGLTGIGLIVSTGSLFYQHEHWVCTRILLGVFAAAILAGFIWLRCKVCGVLSQ